MQADIPRFAKKFFKPNTAMTQTEDWDAGVGGHSRGHVADRAARASRFRSRRPAPPASEAAGGGSVHHIDATIKVSVPLVGGKLERFVFDQAKKTMDLEHEFGRRG